MAEVVRYVDPDVAAGDGSGDSWINAFSSLNTAEADLDGGSNSGDDLTIYWRSSAGTNDGRVTFDGLTYDSVTVEVADGYQALKSGWAAGRGAIVDNSASEATIAVGTNSGPLYLVGFQIDSVNDKAIEVTTDTANEYHFKNCRIRTQSTNFGYYCSRSTTAHVAVFENCIFENCGTAAYCRTAAGGGTTFHNCIFYGNTTGPQHVGGSFACVNCPSFGNTDDFNAGSGIDHCASDDGDGTNAVAAKDGDWTKEYTAPATGNFTVLNSGNCYRGGTDVSLATDIEGDSYHATTPSIGVDEYIAAGGAAPIKRVDYTAYLVR